MTVALMALVVIAEIVVVSVPAVFRNQGRTWGKMSKERDDTEEPLLLPRLTEELWLASGVTSLKKSRSTRTTITTTSSLGGSLGGSLGDAPTQQQPDRRRRARALLAGLSLYVLFFLSTTVLPNGFSKFTPAEIKAALSSAITAGELPDAWLKTVNVRVSDSTVLTLFADNVIVYATAEVVVVLAWAVGGGVLSRR